ncbi:MAG: hypothetical protein U0136_14865 [Bdellovibrionota bacterium]
MDLRFSSDRAASAHEAAAGAPRTLSTERGAIHIVAAILVIIILAVAYTNIQSWVEEKKAEKASEARGQTVKDVFSTPPDALSRIDAEQLRVLNILGLGRTKEELVARIAKMDPEEKALAQQKIGAIIKQPADLPLDRLIDLAFSRWSAVRDYINAQASAPAPAPKR